MFASSKATRSNADAWSGYTSASGYKVLQKIGEKGGEGKSLPGNSSLHHVTYHLLEQVLHEDSKILRVLRGCLFLRAHTAGIVSCCLLWWKHSKLDVSGTPPRFFVVCATIWHKWLSFVT